MEIPGVGKLTQDSEYEDWYHSESVAVPVLDGQTCHITVVGYGEDDKKEDFHVAIANFLALSPEALREVDQLLFDYCKSMIEEGFGGELQDEEGKPLVVASPEDAWKLLFLDRDPVVERRKFGDKGIYVSLEGDCVWEPEHGIQIVFKNGERVSKIGPFDGHLTNADSFEDPSLEDVVYVPLV